MTSDRAGCNHFGDLVSDPVTATNQNPEHRCADCGAVVIPGTSPPRQDRTDHSTEPTVPDHDHQWQDTGFATVEDCAVEGCYATRTMPRYDPNIHPDWCKCQRICGGDQ